MKRAKDAPPLMSAKAREAREEVYRSVLHIETELEDLSETDLKAFAYDMRRFLDGDHDHIRLGNAAAADRKLAILERHREGTGKWFAVIEALEWDPDEGGGESKILAKTECDGKSAAVTEARKLLAKHASNFSEHTEIEAKVLCELEMTNYYYR